MIGNCLHGIYQQIQEYLVDLRRNAPN